MTSPADNTDRCSVCGRALQILGCAPGKWCGALRTVTAPANEHPLPWRWKKDSYEPEDGLWGALVDARGKNLIATTNLDGILSVADEYVRAVTERAGAMEQLLRAVLIEYVPGGDLIQVLVKKKAEDQARALLAEINAAKAGG